MYIVAVTLSLCISGTHKVIKVGCKEDNDLVANDTTTHTSQDKPHNCIHRNCSCVSLDDALASLTTNNTVINITADVMLSSLFGAKDLVNISIIGHGNRTVRCGDNGGGLHLMSCHNCTIENIDWVSCGNDSEQQPIPTIWFTTSSNIKILNCTFQYSMGPGVMLAEVTGDAIVSHCTFKNNHMHRYDVPGAAMIYFATNDTEYYYHNFVFVITNCNFFHNKGLTIVHVDLHASPFSLLLKNSVFHKNQEIPLSVSSKDFNIDGTVLFEENLGGGIYIYDFSSIRFCSNSTVTFKSNIVSDDDGGALYISSNVRVLFDESSTVLFHNNTANNGGAVYMSSNVSVLFDEGSTVLFHNNTANNGGAVYMSSNVSVLFDEGSTVLFHNNTANNGGAVYMSSNTSVLFDQNSTVLFHNNSAIYGGALFSKHNTHIASKENSVVNFDGNLASYIGGAISLSGYTNITFENSIITMNNNIARQSGGAIFTGKNCTITITGNNAMTSADYIPVTRRAMHNENNYSNFQFNGGSIVTFKNNIALFGQGGAIDLEDSSGMYIEQTSILIFTNNVCGTNFGGAVTLLNSFIRFRHHSLVNFSFNSAINGGAIYSQHNSYIILENEVSVLFNENNSTAYGGALHLRKY